MVRNCIRRRRQIWLGRRSKHGLRAFAREGCGNAAAYAAAAARDDHDLALEFFRHLRPPYLPALASLAEKDERSPEVRSESRV